MIHNSSVKEANVELQQKAAQAAPLAFWWASLSRLLIIIIVVIFK